MKTPLLCALLFAGISPFAQAASAPFEALKATELIGSWRSALHSLPAPATPAARKVPKAEPRAVTPVVYRRTGWKLEANASNALSQASSNLTQAGFAVLSSMVVREPSSPWYYGFELEYTQGPQQSQRGIETYASKQSWRSEADAQNEMTRVINSLRGAGYQIVVGQVLRNQSSPWDYTFEVDYLGAAAKPPAQTQSYTSGLYQRQWDAQQGLNAAAYTMQQRGHEILGAWLFQDRRSGWWYFQFRYRALPSR